MTNFKVNHILERAERYAPNHPALSYGDTTQTWSEVAVEARQWTGVLKRLGINNEDRVALLSLNHPFFFIFFFGNLYRDIISVPLNYRYTSKEMVACLKNSTPRILVTDETHEEMCLQLQELCPFIEKVISLSDTPRFGFESYKTLLKKEDPEQTRDEGHGDEGHGDDQVLGIFYTGGTTGEPKGVMMTHTNIYVNSMASVMYYQFKQESVFLFAPPMFHLAAASRVFSQTLAFTHSIILQQYRLDELLKTIEEKQVSHILLVPTMLNLMLDYINKQALAKKAQPDLSSLAYIAYGASPMDPPLLRRAREAFPHVKFSNGYGMTETSPLVTYLSPEYSDIAVDEARNVCSIGLPGPYVEVRIVDLDGNDCPTDVAGEIFIRGPHVMKGYWGKPEWTAQAIVDGWYKSGDMGFQGKDGFLYLVDRAKDMIISGGENIYSAEVESILYGHPDILECAIIGEPDPKWGEIAHAIVRLNDPELRVEKTEQEWIQSIQDFCKNSISSYKCPKKITLREAPFPLSGVNKILKKALREEYATKGTS